MDDTLLYFCLREGRFNCLGESGIVGPLDVTDCPESLGLKMIRLMARLRGDLIEYYTILKAAKEQIG